MAEDTDNFGDEESRRLFRTVFDRTFLVEAGAGTGKTTLLVDRLLSALARGRTDAAGLVAITFTERAAAELQIRVRQALETVVTSGIEGLPGHSLAAFEGIDPSDPAVRERLEKGLRELDRAHISTIHAFCHEMLITRPLEARVDPSGTGLDNETQKRELKDRISEAWLSAQRAGQPEVEGLVDLGYRSEQVTEMALALFEQVDLLGVMDLEPEVYSAAKLRSELADLQKTLEDFINRYSVKPGATLTDLESFLDVLGKATACVGDETLTDHLRDDSAWRGAKFRKPSKTQWDGGVERGKEGVEIAKRAKTLIENELAKADSPAFCAGLEWLRTQVLDGRNSLRKAGVLGFSDLLLMARDLLRDHKDVRGFFQRRFKRILVDEFQDTDPLQAEIAFYLAEKEPRADEWAECELEPGKLCLVADPKQSIYRFRRADIQTYLFVKERIENLPHGETLLISRNFRSSPQVIDWVNATFPELIRETEGRSVQAPYTALEKHRSRGPGGGVFVFAEDLGSKKKDLRPAEQEQIAGIVEHLVGNDDFPVFDRNEGAWRAPRHCDFGVVYPKRTSYEGVEEIFHRRGIPFVSDVGQAFYAREEVQEVATILAAVERPHDPVLLYSALHSPLFGFGDDDLVHLAATGPLSLDRPADDLPGEFVEAFSLLRELHDGRNKRGVARTIRDLLETCRAFELLGANERYGPRKVATLEGLIARAARADTQARWSFEEFVEELSERIVEELKEEGELPITFGGDDVVNLLTIHQAKGLEFPVVILANLCSSLSFGNDVVAETLVRRVPRSSLDLRCGGNKTRGFSAALAQERELEDAEKARQLYVACTRARDYLFVSRAGAGIASTYGKRLASASSGSAPVFEGPQGGGDGGGSGKPRHEKFTPRLLQKREAWAAAREALLEERNETVTVVHPSMTKGDPHAGPSAEAADSAPDPSHRVEPAEGGNDPSPGGELDRNSARAFGTAFHELMASIDLREARNPRSGTSFLSAQEQRARGIAASEGLDADVVRDLLSCLEKTLFSEIFRRALKSDLVLRESPILFPGDEGRLVQGDVDLLFLEGSRWIVVDYKTDRISAGRTSADVAKSYRRQIDLYVAGVKQVTGQEARGYVLLARTGDCVEIS
ncbi:MAG: UvrD-helicase domain-containing protein [Planctomycetota bacterium]|jgi:ATP-dependent helicase/nuclease subunit A